MAPAKSRRLRPIISSASGPGGTGCRWKRPAASRNDLTAWATSSSHRQATRCTAEDNPARPGGGPRAADGRASGAGPGRPRRGPAGLRGYTHAPEVTNVRVVLPDGKDLELPAGATGADLAAAIGPGLAKAALGVKVDGRLSDLQSTVPDGAKVTVVTRKDPDAIQLQRHTLAHVLAQAVRELFVEEGYPPGPVIENGFYYDFDLPRSLTPDDLGTLEERMRRIIAADLPLRKYALPREEAIDRYRRLGDPYKVELIEDLPEGEQITFYEQGGE